MSHVTKNETEDSVEKTKRRMEELIKNGSKKYLKNKVLEKKD